MQSPVEDIRQIQANRRSRIPVFLLLASIFFERFAFYGLMGNLVFYVSNTPYKWFSVNAALLVFLFTAGAFMIPVFAGWLSDTFIGKFWTVLLGYCFYLLGYIFLPMLYSPKDIGYNHLRPSHMCVVQDHPTIRNFGQETCVRVITLAVVSIAFGSACIRAVISPFGAIQVENDPARLRRFFPAFYWVVNAGALLAYGGLSYCQLYYNMFYSYIIACAAVGLSAVLFFAGSPFYITDWPDGSPLNEVFGVIWEAGRISCRYLCCCSPDSMVDQARPVRTMDQPTASLVANEDDDDDSAVMETTVRISKESLQKVTFLDRAKVYNGGTHSRDAVDRTRIFLKTTLLFLSLLIYWFCFSQMHSTFVVQGLHMDLNISETKFQVPTTWLLLVEVVTVLIAVPLSSYIIQRVNRCGWPLSPYFRIGLGILFAVAAMVCAGIVELERMNYYTEGHHLVQNISNRAYNASGLSILWQIPQHVLIGCSDTLTTVATIECAFTQAPKSMQSIMTGMLWFVSGCSGLLGVVLLEFADSVLIPKKNTGDSFINSVDHRFAYYFFGLAGVLVLSFGVFVIVVRLILPRWSASQSENSDRSPRSLSPSFFQSGTSDNMPS